MFFQAGFRDPHELIVGHKEQTEPQPDFEGYAAFEAVSDDDVFFDFYMPGETERTLRALEIPNPSSKHKGEEVKRLVSLHRRSALQALTLFKDTKQACDHTVHVLRGIR